MNKMTRVLLLLISLLAVAFTANAASKPTALVEVCVTLQGSRSATQLEPVDWKLYAAGTSTVAYSPADGGDMVATPPANGTKACFDVIGVPNTVYDLYIKGSDHLAKKISDWQYPSGGSVDLSATVTLLEGDANNDNQVNFLDLIIFAATFNKTGTAIDPRGDFNEDGNVNFLDLIPFAANWTKAGDAMPVLNARSVETPSTVIGTVEVVPSATAPACATAGSTYPLEIYADLSGNDAVSAQLAMTFTTASANVAFGTAQWGSSISAPAVDDVAGTLGFAAFDTTPKTGRFLVATLNVTVDAAAAPGTSIPFNFVTATDGGSSGTQFGTSGSIQIVPATYTDFDLVVGETVGGVLQCGAAPSASYVEAVAATPLDGDLGLPAGQICGIAGDTRQVEIYADLNGNDAVSAQLAMTFATASANIAFGTAQWSSAISAPAVDDAAGTLGFAAFDTTPKTGRFLVAVLDVTVDPAETVGTLIPINFVPGAGSDGTQFGTSGAIQIIPDSYKDLTVSVLHVLHFTLLPNLQLCL